MRLPRPARSWRHPLAQPRRKGRVGGGNLLRPWPHVAGQPVRLVGGQPGVEPWLLVQGGRATTTKTRFLANGQHMLRADHEEVAPIQQRLAALEGGAAGAAFGSGLAAITAVFQGLQPGDHVVAPRDIYHGTANVLKHLFAKWGVQFTFVNMTDLDATRATRVFADHAKSLAGGEAFLAALRPKLSP
mgnify:CR=1 FL=1